MPAACRSSCRWKQHRLVVNCGLPAVNRENWRQVARATAAHSTVTFNDTSSCRFLESGSFRRLLSACRSSAARATCRSRARTRADGVMLRASHDGYAADFGVDPQPRHAARRRRRRALDGEDSFHAGRRPRACRRRAADEYAIRFHLHPAVKANRLSDGHGVILLLPDKEVWTFATYGETVRARGKRLSWPAPTARAAPCRS